MTSVTIVVHAWSRLFVLPIGIAMLIALRTAPALGWPRSAPGAGVAAWLALALIPFPMQAMLGEVDLMVVMVLLVIASRSANDAVATHLVVGWVVVLTALSVAFGTLVVSRMSTLVWLSLAGVAYLVALSGFAWLWWRWPWQTLPQRLSMWAVACIWAGVLCAPWDWSWQTVLVYAVCMTATGGVWWFRQANRAPA